MPSNQKNILEQSQNPNPNPNPTQNKSQSQKPKPKPRPGNKLSGNILCNYDGKKFRKTYHICLSSKNEVMFRSDEDFHRAFNYYALALHKTDSIGLADSFMSNHLHIVVQTSCPETLMYAFRNSYARYFNLKYHRKGRLGEKRHFCIELNGLHHIMAAISYTLRNAMHHGVTATPFGYKHNSANAIFRKELGKTETVALLPKKFFHRYIGKHNKIPQNFMMDTNGLIIRECVTDILLVETFYTTPKAFNFYMSRKSGSDWEKEQDKDHNGQPPITLATIEHWTLKHSPEITDINGNIGNIDGHVLKMLRNEYGRNDYNKIQDTELCSKIDSITNTHLHKSSIYQLTAPEKAKIAEIISREHFVPTNQLHRCLAINYIGHN